MFWDDEKKTTAFQVSDDVVDVMYSITCKSLPLDHAKEFTDSIMRSLNWIADEELAGIHLVHGAESGNGWVRPENPETQLLHLSRRAKMMLRVPKSRIEDAKKLTGQVLDIDGYSMEVGNASVKLFSSLSTQFSRYIVIPADIDIQDETAFMEYAAREIQTLGISVKKMLCGKRHFFLMADSRKLHTRSLMLAELEHEEAVLLQQKGGRWA